MASARNLCQHSDNDGQQCTSNDYVLCPHCQLQLCLTHLNHHQDLLRSELYTFCDSVDRTRVDFDSLVFDAANRRQHLVTQLDEWYQQQLNALDRTYTEKKQQLKILCWKSHMEFNTCRFKKEKQLKGNLVKQLARALKQRHVHVDDLNEMRNKLDYIQRGLDELKQLRVDVQFRSVNFDINIVKKRYVEAAKPLFNDDDDNLWETDGDEDTDAADDKQSSRDNLAVENSCDCQETLVSSPLILLSCAPPSPTTVVKKAPLKLVIKRLRHSSASNTVKYKLHAVNASLPIST